MVGSVSTNINDTCSGNITMCVCVCICPASNISALFSTFSFLVLGNNDVVTNAKQLQFIIKCSNQHESYFVKLTKTILIQDSDNANGWFRGLDVPLSKIKSQLNHINGENSKL